MHVESVVPHAVVTFQPTILRDGATSGEEATRNNNMLEFSCKNNQTYKDVSEEE